MSPCLSTCSFVQRFCSNLDGTNRGRVRFVHLHFQLGPALTCKRHQTVALLVRSSLVPTGQVPTRRQNQFAIPFGQLAGHYDALETRDEIRCAQRLERIVSGIILLQDKLSLKNEEEIVPLCATRRPRQRKVDRK